jgi:hypothetical protein
MWKYIFVIYQLAKYFEEQGLCRDVIRRICFFIDAKERDRRKAFSQSIMDELTNKKKVYFDEGCKSWRHGRTVHLIANWRELNVVYYHAINYYTNIYSLWIDEFIPIQLPKEKPPIPARYFYSLDKKVDLNT